MEYQKIINLLGNTPNPPTKLRTKNWVEINDDAHKTCNTNSQIKFKASVLKSCLCDCSDAYITVSGTVTIDEEGDDNAAKQADERSKRSKI